jgi:D-3-phosphoglycerate dehydrogenase/C-terminal binding protein
MSKLPRVVVTDYINDDLAPERDVLDGVAEVVAADARTEEALLPMIQDASGLIVYHFVNITAASMDLMTDCKVISRAGVAIINIDLDAACERGIPVTNVPDYGSEDVADSAVGMMLALTRGIHVLNSHYRPADHGLDWTYRSVAPLQRLRGRVLGIIGMGRIGTAVALRAKAIGMDVLFYDPYVASGTEKALGVRRAATLDQLLGEAFVVSVHSLLTDETKNMIDAAAIAKMQKGSYLINNARGAIVDTSAIPDALASGQLAGAAIDVLSVEPPPEDDPLMRAWRDPDHPAHHNLIVNPHAAFYCEGSVLELRTKSAESVRKALVGEALENVMNGVG